MSTSRPLLIGVMLDSWSVSGPALVAHAGLPSLQKSSQNSGSRRSATGNVARLVNRDSVWESDTALVGRSLRPTISPQYASSRRGSCFWPSHSGSSTGLVKLVRRYEPFLNGLGDLILVSCVCERLTGGYLFLKQTEEFCKTMLLSVRVALYFDHRRHSS